MRRRNTDVRQIGFSDEAGLWATTKSQPKDTTSHKSERNATAPIRSRTSIKRNKMSKAPRGFAPRGSPLDQLSSSEYRIYSYLHGAFLHQGGDGDGKRMIIAVGYAELSKMANVSKRTLARALTRLEEKGYIVQHFPLVRSKQNTKAYEVRSPNEIPSNLAEKAIDHRASHGAENHAMSHNNNDKIKPNTAAGQKPKRTA